MLSWLPARRSSWNTGPSRNGYLRLWPRWKTYFDSMAIWTNLDAIFWWPRFRCGFWMLLNQCRFFLICIYHGSRRKSGIFFDMFVSKQKLFRLWSFQKIATNSTQKISKEKLGSGAKFFTLNPLRIVFPLPLHIFQFLLQYQLLRHSKRPYWRRCRQCGPEDGIFCREITCEFPCYELYIKAASFWLPTHGSVHSTWVVASLYNWILQVWMLKAESEAHQVEF